MPAYLTNSLVVWGTTSQLTLKNERAARNFMLLFIDALLFDAGYLRIMSRLMIRTGFATRKSRRACWLGPRWADVIVEATKTLYYFGTKLKHSLKAIADAAWAYCAFARCGFRNDLNTVVRGGTSATVHELVSSWLKSPPAPG
jgi:hypothetical protein